MKNITGFAVPCLCLLVTGAAALFVVGCLGPTSVNNKKTAAVASAGCDTALVQNGNEDEGGIQAQFALLAGPYYDPEVKTIMTNKCVNCHGAGAQAPALTTYAQVKAAMPKILMRISNTAQPMPNAAGGGLMPQAMQDTIKAWNTNNLVEKADPVATPTPTATSTGGGSTPPATASVTFIGNVKPLLSSKCGGSTCHGPTFIDITSYSFVKDNLEGTLMPRMTNDAGIMPPASRGGKLAASDMKIIEDWKAGGFVEGSAAVIPTPSKGTGDECKADSPDDAKKKAIELLRHPEGMKKCTDAKQVYNRKSKSCVTDSALIAETCDKAWVDGVSMAVADSVKKEIKDKVDSGWEIEQCATQGKDSLFYMIKIDSKPDTPTIESKGYLIPQ